MLSDPDGLPLGLLFLKQQFLEAQFLISSEFRFGLAGLTRWWKRWLLGLFIVVATLISLFAGPSAATLMIPILKYDWPAGGASFWLLGDEESLWPSTLTESSIGGEHCRSPDLNTITQSRDWNLSGCIWTSSAQLAASYQQSHLRGIESYNFDDGVLTRVAETRANAYEYEQWFAIPHLVVGLVAKAIGEAWYESILLAGSGKYRTLKYRAKNETTDFVKSWIPATRTQCEIQDEEQLNDSAQLKVCTAKRHDQTNFDYGRVPISARIQCRS